MAERMSTVFSRKLLLAILNIQYQGSGSPSTISPEPDYTDYTPLKKRRLANYREAEEEVRAASEKVRFPSLCLQNLPSSICFLCQIVFTVSNESFAAFCRRSPTP